MKRLSTTSLIAFTLLAFTVPAFAMSLDELGSVDDFQRLGLFMVVSLVGCVSHYYKKWLRGEIEGSLKTYIVGKYSRETVLMLVTLVGVTLTMFFGNQIQGLNLQQLLVLAFTTGYTVDSAVNKGATP